MAVTDYSSKSDRELLALAYPYLENHWDEGPLHAGWKSEGFEALTDEIRQRNTPKEDL